jgi:hypothetical protein
MAHDYAQVVRDEWVSFPGGELEGRRPTTLCPSCREALKREATSRFRPSGPSRPLCFQCYRAGLDRERALTAAGQLDTATDARFQWQLPFEPINAGRLAELKRARADARIAASVGIGVYADKRRQAQLAARHALQAIADGLRAHRGAPERTPEMTAAIHAVELQLPEAWLPFVVGKSTAR